MSSLCYLEHSREWAEPVSRVLHSGAHWQVIGPASRWSGGLFKALRQRPDVYLIGFESVDTSGLGLISKVLQLDRGALILALIPADKGLSMASMHAGAHGVCFRSEIMDSLITGLCQVQQGKYYLSPECTRITITECLSPQPLQKVAIRQVVQAALTPKEAAIMSALRGGRPTKQIAQGMAISVYTVNQHLRSIYRKLNVHNRTEAASLAHMSDLI
jgi:DNA-binding NarL/FixJ family response regulator